MSDTKINKVAIKKHHEEIQTVWEISHIFSAPRRSHHSPEFSFGNRLWHMELLPKSEDYPGFMRFVLRCNKSQENSVHYRIDLRKVDGTVMQVMTGILEGNKQLRDSKDNFMKFSDFLQKKTELAPSDVLTFTCSLKYDTGDSTVLDDKPKLKKIIDLKKLSENFKALLTNKESCDTILKVKDKEYQVHKAVLIGRSPIFDAMFKHDTKEKQTGIITVPDCDADSFEEFLEYLYCGQLEEISFRSAFHLYETSDKYDVQELKSFCVEYLMENLTLENFADAAIMADKYDETKLLSAVQEFFIRNAKKVFVTSEWERLLENDFRLANKFLIEMSKVKLED